MLSVNNLSFRRNYREDFLRRSVLTIFCSLAVLIAANHRVQAQGPVNGGFEGRVTDGADGKPVANISVIFVNLANGYQAARKTDQNGYFRQDTLSPGVYQITVEVPGYKPREFRQVLYATRSNETVPVPIILEKESAAVALDPNASPNPSPSPVSTAAIVNNDEDKATSDTNEGASLNPRRDEAFNEFRVRALPLGGTTLTRTFDELAFLAAGVAPPPQAIGGTVGPGVGGGVGTSGQFSVNGLRSRANNFTVDGSDNNDEDIGVRRQGFFTLVPQPIESIQEFQIITLLAPAQYGRNLGAQVNAISKSGGNGFHGAVYGMLDSSPFNARNFFDNAGGNTSALLTAGRAGQTNVPVFVDGTRKSVFNGAGEKDNFDLFQGGFTLGGRLVRNKMFFFVSGEIQSLNATQEKHFAVPTVEQRGLFNSGASGLQQCRLQLNANEVPACVAGANYVPGYPTSVDGDAVFSLFPFANDSNGIYGRNTYTQELSADARGLILSGRYDYNFSMRGRPQTLTARYNFTDDERDLTDVGGALFSAIRPLVRTDNFSAFTSGGITDKISNEFRFSWGRTTLEFEELRDKTGFLRPLARRFNNPKDARFLLNAPNVLNSTLAGNCNANGCSAASQARYFTFDTTENSNLGPIGQLIIAGFSPVGVDVFNFPQERENNTFQFADTIRWQVSRHNLAFGADIRRTILDSDLPRNSRPLVTFNGGVATVNGQSVVSSPLNLAAGGAATGFFQSLALPGTDSRIKLSYNQLNFFAQDDWRVARNFLINIGARYEFNTVPKEADRKIENTFQAPSSVFPNIPTINLYQGFNDFIDGRTEIFNADSNNLAPRVGFAFAPSLNTVIRGGYGIYYDQILGAAVSQSRNVFPTFTTINTGGGELFCNTYFPNTNGGPLTRVFSLLNPITGSYSPTSCGSQNRFPFVQPGTLNTLNPQFNRLQLLRQFLIEFPFENGTPIGAVFPTRKLNVPLSHQYSFSVEQKLFGDTFLSAAYVGTLGKDLLRFTTPNLGNNYIARADNFTLYQSGVDENGNPIVFYTGQPSVTGTTFDPFNNSNRTRPNPNIGFVNQFETTGESRYDSLQIGLRGNFSSSNFQYQVNYVFGRVEDDVSDVFDLAGASALPQNSVTFAGEYAPANFDVRHRLTYNFVYDLPRLANRNIYVRGLLGDWRIAGTGKFNTGQPFTVNSIFDINFDGNLTDRLNNTQFITETDDRRQPLRLSDNANLQAMLATFGQDGAVPRNSFRAGNVLELDLSLIKRFVFTENQNLQFRFDVFNFINRANFGIPVRFLESPGFGQATDTVTPGRRVQLALKYNF